MGMRADTRDVKQEIETLSPERKRALLVGGASIFVGAGALNLIEAAIPGGPSLSLLPGVAAFALAAILLTVGRRLPVSVLVWLGPLGAALIGVAVATTDGPGDGAILYILPVLWQAYFFGRRGAILIVAWVALVQALALLYLPAADAYFDRWLDVVASVAVVAGVVEFLATRNRRLVEQLVAEARMDNLTGLLNRRGFAERAGAELARSRREASWLGVASFDLDHFKAINDEYGHEVGDQVLVKVSEFFRAEMRESDVLARMGGEEFVALLPGDSAADAAALAERVRARLEDSEDPGLPSVTVSAGVVSAIGPADLDALLRDADRALYEAKYSGRNRTVTRPLPVG
jgi:diguanylate cyclase (GGDEF)-like protein